MRYFFLFPVFFLTLFQLSANGYERFEENGKVGLKDNTGKIILPASFDELGWSDGNFSIISQITGYRQKDHWGLINLNKQFITKAEFQTITCPGGDRVIVSRYINPYTIKFGCIDLAGKVVMPFDYDGIKLNGLRAIVMVRNGTRFEYGLVDLNDRSILPVRYHDIQPIGSLRYAVKDFSGKTALCSDEGKWVTGFVIDEISVFRFDLAIIRKEWMRGVIDRNGIIRIEPAYREINILGPDKIYARRSDEWKVIDISQKDIRRIDADDLINKGRGLSEVRMDGMSGLVDRDYKLLWPLCYEYIGPVENNTAVVRQNGLYGLSRMDQTPVMPLMYDSICTDRNFVRVRVHTLSRRSWELYDTFGIKKTISPYEYLGPFNGKFFSVKNGGYWGVVDRYGTEKIACVYDSILDTTGDLVAVRFKGQYGIVTTEDHWRLPPQRSRVTLINDDCFLEWKDSLCFLKDFGGNAIYFTDNPIAIFPDYLRETLPDGTEKEINFQGQTLSRKEPVVARMERVFPESEGLTGIRRDGKYGFVDSRGRLRIANRYDDIGPFHQGLAPVKLLNKWGFINTSDQIVIQPNFDAIGTFDQDVAVVSKAGKSGLVDARGKVLLELRYDAVERLPGPLFLLSLNSLKGLADGNGRVLIEPRFESLTIANTNVIVKQNGRYGLLTKDGMSVFPIKYSTLFYQPENDVFLVQLKAEWETIEIK